MRSPSRASKGAEILLRSLLMRALPWGEAPDLFTVYSFGFLDKMEVDLLPVVSTALA